MAIKKFYTQNETISDALKYYVYHAQSKSVAPSSKDMWQDDNSGNAEMIDPDDYLDAADVLNELNRQITNRLSDEDIYQDEDTFNNELDEIGEDAEVLYQQLDKKFGTEEFDDLDEDLDEGLGEFESDVDRQLELDWDQEEVYEEEDDSTEGEYEDAYNSLKKSNKIPVPKPIVEKYKRKIQNLLMMARQNLLKKAAEAKRRQQLEKQNKGN